MKRMNIPFKPIGLAALLLLSGSGLAAAAEPVAVPEIETAVVQATQTRETPAAVNTEIIRLAWDRVGQMA